MSVWSPGTPPLATHDLISGLEALRRGFARQAADSNLFMVFLTLIGLCVFVLLLDQVYRYLQRRPRPRQVDYLAAAARVLGLSARELRDLRRIAAGARLPYPAILLLSPANLACGLWRAFPRRAGLHERMEQLCVSLFGVGLPGPQAAEHAAHPPGPAA